MHIFTRLEAFIIRDDIGLVYRAVSTRNMMRSEVRRSTARKEVAECGIGDCAVDKRTSHVTSSFMQTKLKSWLQRNSDDDRFDHTHHNEPFPNIKGARLPPQGIRDHPEPCRSIMAPQLRYRPQPEWRRWTQHEPARAHQRGGSKD
jgi:hypothetical protein